MSSISNEEVTPMYHLPPRLTSIAATMLVRLLVYEDYKECNYYRWDPVRIWQFELPQPKKKRNKSTRSQVSPYHTNVTSFSQSPPPWKDFLKLRDWFLEESSDILMKTFHEYISSALERQSWSSLTDEEHVLFFFLALIMDPELHFGSNIISAVPRAWCEDLQKIIDRLGPFRLTKLVSYAGSFNQNHSSALYAKIILNSPNLQILRINQWDLCNDILYNLGTSCKKLEEFSICGMEPTAFLSDDCFFRCFFDGMSAEEVLQCYQNKTSPRISFEFLRYIDILYCRNTERVIQMLSIYYPHTPLSCINGSIDGAKLLEKFICVGAKNTAMRLSTDMNALLQNMLVPLARLSPYLKELRLHIDDDFPNADLEKVYEQKLDEASENLLYLVKNIPTLDSITIQPTEGVDMNRVLGLTFTSLGHRLRCLHLSYERTPICFNSLYALLNMCSQLRRLTISFLNCAKLIKPPAISIVELHSMPYLETFVVEVWDDDANSYYEQNHLKLTKDVLQEAPHLKNLSLCCCEYLMIYGDSLHSQSVKHLDLRFTFLLADFKQEEDCYQWLTKFLPNFPVLKTLSLDTKQSKFWLSCLKQLCNRDILVTRKKLEFANVFRWEERLLTLTYSVAIM